MAYILIAACFCIWNGQVKSNEASKMNSRQQACEHIFQFSTNLLYIIPKEHASHLNSIRCVKTWLHVQKHGYNMIRALAWENIWL